jgi:hypothetical protein
MKHNRKLFPQQTHNHRGEPVFDMDEKAKQQLREDVENKLYTAMSASELRQRRAVYQKYKPRIFRHRIYQEIRRQKMLRYLEKKRKEKRLAFEAKKRGDTITFKRNKKEKSKK